MTSKLQPQMSLLLSTKHVGSLDAVEINERLRWAKIPTSTTAQNKLRTPEIVWWPCMLYKNFTELHDDLDESLKDFRARCMVEDSKSKLGGRGSPAVAYFLGFYPPLVRTLKNYACSPIPKDGEDTFRLDKEGRNVELKDYFSFRQKSRELAAASQATTKLRKIFEFNLNLADKIADAECVRNNILGISEHAGLDRPNERKNEAKFLIGLAKGEVKEKTARSINVDLDNENTNQAGSEQTVINVLQDDANPQSKLIDKSDCSRVYNTRHVKQNKKEALKLSKTRTGTSQSSSKRVFHLQFNTKQHIHARKSVNVTSKVSKIEFPNRRDDQPLSPMSFDIKIVDDKGRTDSGRVPINTIFTSDCTSTFWQQKVKEGWRIEPAKKYNNEIHKTYYIPPKVDPANPNQLHGIHYFSLETDAKKWCLKHEEQLVTNNPKHITTGKLEGSTNKRNNKHTEKSHPISNNEQQVDRSVVKSIMTGKDKTKKRKAHTKSKFLNDDGSDAANSASTETVQKKQRKIHPIGEQVKGNGSTSTKERVPRKAGKQNNIQVESNGNSLEQYEGKKKKSSGYRERKTPFMEQKNKRRKRLEENTSRMNHCDNIHDRGCTPHSPISIAESKSHTFDAQFWWLHEPIPSFTEAWRTLQKLRFTYSNGVYRLPGIKRVKFNTSGIFENVPLMRKYLCKNGLPMSSDDCPNNITQDEIDQLTRWVSLAHLPTSCGGMHIKADSSLDVFCGMDIVALSDEDAQKKLLSNKGARTELKDDLKNSSMENVKVHIRCNGISPTWSLCDRDKVALILWSSLSKLPTNERTTHQNTEKTDDSKSMVCPLKDMDGGTQFGVDSDQSDPHDITDANQNLISLQADDITKKCTSNPVINNETVGSNLKEKNRMITTNQVNRPKVTALIKNKRDNKIQIPEVDTTMPHAKNTKVIAQSRDIPEYMDSKLQSASDGWETNNALHDKVNSIVSVKPNLDVNSSMIDSVKHDSTTVNLQDTVSKEMVEGRDYGGEGVTSIPNVCTLVRPPTTPLLQSTGRETNSEVVIKTSVEIEAVPSKLQQIDHILPEVGPRPNFDALNMDDSTTNTSILKNKDESFPPRSLTNTKVTTKGSHISHLIKLNIDKPLQIPETMVVHKNAYSDHTQKSSNHEEKAELVKKTLNASVPLGGQIDVRNGSKGVKKIVQGKSLPVPIAMHSKLDNCVCVPPINGNDVTETHPKVDTTLKTHTKSHESKKIVDQKEVSSTQTATPTVAKVTEKNTYMIRSMKPNTKYGGKAAVLNIRADVCDYASTTSNYFCTGQARDSDACQEENLAPNLISGEGLALKNKGSRKLMDVNDCSIDTPDLLGNGFELDKTQTSFKYDCVSKVVTPPIEKVTQRNLCMSESKDTEKINTGLAFPGISPRLCVTNDTLKEQCTDQNKNCYMFSRESKAQNLLGKNHYESVLGKSEPDVLVNDKYITITSDVEGNGMDVDKDDGYQEHVTWLTQPSSTDLINDESSDSESAQGLVPIKQLNSSIKSMEHLCEDRLHTPSKHWRSNKDTGHNVVNLKLASVTRNSTAKCLNTMEASDTLHTQEDTKDPVGLQNSSFPQSENCVHWNDETPALSSKYISSRVLEQRISLDHEPQSNYVEKKNRETYLSIPMASPAITAAVPRNYIDTTYCKKESSAVNNLHQEEKSRISSSNDSISTYGKCDNINLSLASNIVGDNFGDDGINRLDIGGDISLFSFLNDNDLP